MAQPQTHTFFNKYFFSLFILFLHLGCFIFTANTKKPKTFKPRYQKCKPFSSSWAIIKRIVSFKSKSKNKATSLTLTQISARPSTSNDETLQTSSSTPSSIRHQVGSTQTTSDPSFSLPNDIYPCPTCGEIFFKSSNLTDHQAIKHAVSELYDNNDNSSRNIVQIIFNSSWNNKTTPKEPNIERILKIHNSAKILTKFEEYRNAVKLKAGRMSVRKRDERCLADGNELLRFHCSTMVCNLGLNGNSSICSQCYCSVCGILRSGFSSKLDGISTLNSSWRAHASLPDDLEEEFAFMNVKRVMLVCRVVAGRVGNEGEDDCGFGLEKGESGFDSVHGSSHGAMSRLDEEELLVFNPRAVLPCFAIIYSV